MDDYASLQDLQPLAGVLQELKGLTCLDVRAQSEYDVARAALPGFLVLCRLWSDWGSCSFTGCDWMRWWGWMRWWACWGHRCGRCRGLLCYSSWSVSMITRVAFIRTYV